MPSDDIREASGAEGWSVAQIVRGCISLTGKQVEAENGHFQSTITHESSLRGHLSTDGMCNAIPP